MKQAILIFCSSVAVITAAVAQWAMSPREDPAAGLVAQASNASLHEIARKHDQPWSVQVLADIQDGFLYLPRILREGEALGVDAIVIAGDLARGGGGSHLPLLLDVLHRHPPKVPLFAVPGNHDSVTDTDRRSFIRSFGDNEFEFKIGHTWFVGLDSTAPMSRTSQQQLSQRIESARSAAERVVIVRHHSPLSGATPYENPESDPELAERLAQPSVAFVFAGHAHRWRLDRFRGVPFLIVPPSGDRSHGQGQTAISYVILRWTGERFLVEHHHFFRDNWTELATALRHVFLAHVRPSIRKFVLGDDSLSGSLGDVAFGVTHGLER